VQVQNEVIRNLADVKLLNPEQVNKIDSEIGKKIAYLSGGEEYFLNLIEHSDHETHLNIISALEQVNPTTAERVRRELFFFEDVNILEKTALQRLLRESQRRGYSFALALKTSSDELKNKVTGIMTQDAKAMLLEQMELLGEVSDKRITEEQRLIANLARELEKSGVIIIDRTKK
jgi:flagellar motor switch protein FliG